MLTSGDRPSPVYGVNAQILPPFKCLAGYHYHSRYTFWPSAHRPGWSTPSLQWLYTCVDYFIHWAEAIPITDCTAETVTEAFLHTWISHFGTLCTVNNDHGRQLEWQQFEWHSCSYWERNTYIPLLITPKPMDWWSVSFINLNNTQGTTSPRMIDWRTTSCATRDPYCS